MKLPISFGSRLFLRLLIPGAIAALGLLPALLGISSYLELEIGHATMFAITTLAAGWFITLIDMPIYMLFEGRRFWPASLRKCRLEAQNKKIENWLRKADDCRLKQDETTATEYDILAYRYPIGGGDYPPKSGKPEAVMPTELGNVITGYETYATVKYGADGLFFWDRIWMGLDDDLRKSLDDQQALCDSALYASFTSITNAGIYLFYGLLEKFGKIELISDKLAGENFFIALFFVVFFFIFYKAAISTNYQFGERIKAMFDTHLDKIGIGNALEVITEKTGQSYDTTKFDPNRVRAAWRYLRWHEFKRASGSESMDIETVSSQDDSPATQ